MITVKSKFDPLQEISETHIPNDEYENFFIVQVEIAAECIATKLTNKSRVPWSLENKIKSKKHPNLIRETDQTPNCRNGRKPLENLLKHAKKNKGIICEAKSIR